MKGNKLITGLSLGAIFTVLLGGTLIGCVPDIKTSVADSIVDSSTIYQNTLNDSKDKSKQIDDLTSQLSIKQSEYDALSLKLKGVQDNLSTCTSKIHSIFTSCNISLAVSTSATDDDNVKIAKAELTAIDSYISSLVTEINNLKTEIDTLEQNIANVDTLIDDIYQAIPKGNTVVIAGQDTTEYKISCISKYVDTLTTDSNDIYTKIQNTAKSCGVYYNSMGSSGNAVATTRLSMIADNYTAMVNTLQSLQQQVEMQNTTMTDLTNQITDLKTQIETLTNEQTNLNAQIESLNATIADLNNKLSTCAVSLVNTSKRIQIGSYYMNINGDLNNVLIYDVKQLFSTSTDFSLCNEDIYHVQYGTLDTNIGTSQQYARTYNKTFASNDKYLFTASYDVTFKDENGNVIDINDYAEAQTTNASLYSVSYSLYSADEIAQINKDNNTSFQLENGIEKCGFVIILSNGSTLSKDKSKEYSLQTYYTNGTDYLKFYHQGLYDYFESSSGLFGYYTKKINDINVFISNNGTNTTLTLASNDTIVYDGITYTAEAEKIVTKVVNVSPTDANTQNYEIAKGSTVADLIKLLPTVDGYTFELYGDESFTTKLDSTFEITNSSVEWIKWIKS